MPELRIGVDLGGTKIEVMALDTEGTTHAVERRPTPRGGQGPIIEEIAQLVESIEARLSARGTVGVGIPGGVGPDGSIVRVPNVPLELGHGFTRALSERLARPVRIANDANCFVLSEAVDGAGQGASMVFGVILGTGVGGGIVHDGKIWTGPNGIAGEWGHNPMPWPEPDELSGPRCGCGKLLCMETFLSGPAVQRIYRESGGGDVQSVSGIAAAAAAGHQLAEAVLSRYENRLARALATVINLLDPSVIVLGGGLSNMERLYSNVPPLLGRYAFREDVGTPVRRALHGDSSGVRGAAWLWP